MFHKVRANIFETNSSYSHSLAVKGNFPLEAYKPNQPIYNQINDSLDTYGEMSWVLNPELPKSGNKWIDFFSYLIVRFAQYGRYKVIDSMLEFYKEFTGYPMYIVCDISCEDDDYVTVLDYVKDKYVIIKYNKDDLPDNIHTFKLYKAEDFKYMDYDFDDCLNSCENLADVKNDVYKWRIIVYPDCNYFPVNKAYLSSYHCIENYIDLFNYNIPDEIFGRIIGDFMRYGICDLYSDYDCPDLFNKYATGWVKINKNGNGYVSLFSNGTKIITSEDDNFIPEYPVSIDVKITDKCSHNCPFCYENSCLNGIDGNAKFIKLLEELPESTEVAIGGGNPIESRLLEKILLSESKCTFTFTINQKDADNLFSFVPVDPEDEDGYSNAPERKLKKEFYSKAKAIGISVTEITDEFIKKAEQFSKSFSRTTSVVWHFIAGIVKYEDLIRFLKVVTNSKILILGYKEKGRGIDYLSHNTEIAKNQKELAEHIDEIRENTYVATFDNLAIEQMSIENKITEDEWKIHYLGSEGKYSMFIDMVKGEFTVSSNDKRRWKIEDGMSIKSMFKIVSDNAE